MNLTGEQKDLVNKIEKAHNRISAISTEIQAKYMLYEAACMMTNKEGMQQNRDDIHTLVDLQLDLKLGIHQMTERIATITRNQL